MPPNGNGVDGECKECRDGSIECGEDPCQAGGGGLPPYVFRGTAWLPVEIGLDAAIRVYARARFTLDDEGRPVLDDKNMPVHSIDVYLDMPFRSACVRQGSCKKKKKNKNKKKSANRQERGEGR